MINNPALGSFKFQKLESCTNNQIILVPNIPTPILDKNLARGYAAFINNSEAEITLILGNADKKSFQKGITLAGYGSSFEILPLNWYIGEVSAISSTSAKISVVECI